MDHDKLLSLWLEYSKPRGMVQRKLAGITGLTQPHISKIKRGERKPEPNTIRRLAEGFGVSVDEYLAGPPGSNLGSIEYGIPVPTDEDANLLDTYTLIPHYDVSVSAGPGAIIEQEAIKSVCAFRIDWIRRSIHSSPTDLFLVDVSGDSMEPTLSDGDTVLVNKSMTMLNKDGMYVFRFNGTLLVKRLRLHVNGKLEISSDNTSYSKLIIEPTEQKDIRVLGRVLWYGRTVY